MGKKVFLYATFFPNYLFLFTHFFKPEKVFVWNPSFLNKVGANNRSFGDVLINTVLSSCVLTFSYHSPYLSFSLTSFLLSLFVPSLHTSYVLPSLLCLLGCDLHFPIVSDLPSSCLSLCPVIFLKFLVSSFFSFLFFITVPVCNDFLCLKGTFKVK